MRYQIIEKDRKILVECKPSAKLETTTTKQQFRIGRAWCAENDYEYHILTDTEIRSGHRLKNIKLLWKYARISTPHEVLWHLKDYLSANGNRSTVNDVCQHLGEVHGQANASYKQFIYNLLFHHRLSFNPKEKLTPSSLVNLPL